MIAEMVFTNMGGGRGHGTGRVGAGRSGHPTKIGHYIENLKEKWKKSKCNKSELQMKESGV